VIQCGDGTVDLGMCMVRLLEHEYSICGPMKQLTRSLVS
jgi:hypothetical protein